MWLLTVEADLVVFVINLLSRVLDRIHRNSGFEPYGCQVSVLLCIFSFRSVWRNSVIWSHWEKAH